MITLKDRLSQWTDVDGAAHELGQVIGLFSGDFGKWKHLLWIKTGEAVYNMLEELVKIGAIEKHEMQYRWNKNFDANA